MLEGICHVILTSACHKSINPYSRLVIRMIREAFVQNVIEKEIF